MKIVFLGNFDAPHSTENEWAYSYEDLGHEVIRFQEPRDTTDQVLQACMDADIFHYTHTHGWDTPGSFDVGVLIDRIRNETKAVSIGVHLDYWYGLERQKDVGTHPWWRCDYIFTADGGSDAWYRSQGINHHYVKAGVVKRDCYIGNYREEYACDVAFVGAYGYHPEYSYRPQLIDWLQDTYGERFRRYAGDTQYGTVRGSALNDVYASVKVVVGDTLCLGFNHPEYFSDRLFETTGRGGFLIFPFIEGVQNCFEIEGYSSKDAKEDKFFTGNKFVQKELETYTFNDFGGLKDKIDYYIAHEDERKSIANAGFERTKADHTYHNRVEEVFDILRKDGRI